MHCERRAHADGPVHVLVGARAQCADALVAQCPDHGADLRGRALRPNGNGGGLPGEAEDLELAQGEPEDSAPSPPRLDPTPTPH